MISPSYILAARQAAYLSQAEAAALVYCSQNAWSLWESGQRKMPRGLWELFLIRIESLPAAAPVSPSAIRAARNAVGLDPKQAARLVYCSTAAWVSWERGARTMPATAWALFSKRAAAPLDMYAAPSPPTAAIIRASRERRGLSQAEAAASVYASGRSWAAWESGARPIPLDAWALFLSM